MLEPLTPQGGEGASSTSACGCTRRAAIWQTSPPMEWPTSTGRSGRSAQSFTRSAA
jgi:hypothetical protein